MANSGAVDLKQRARTVKVSTSTGMQAQAKHLSFIRNDSVALETVRWAGWSSVQLTVQCRYVRMMMVRLRRQMNKFHTYLCIRTLEPRKVM